jgi:PAS domain S-box-containing protein
MSARVLSHDWSSTPLGPLENWPQSLRVAVGICLNSRFPMFVWWGEELINIYNDAYIPVLGKRHPHALGRPARSIWGEIWDVIGPQADAVMKRGEASWNERVLLVMERNNYTENTYFTWSYSPIPDEAGSIGGLFCACTEETPRVLAERERDRLLMQLNTERSRLAEAFRQSPAFIAVLHGPEHTFEMFNDRYAQLVGRRDILRRPIREALPEIASQGFIDLLDEVYRSGETYVGTGTRAMLLRESGFPLEERYLDFVFQPIREDGKVTGILVHGVDVTDRRRVELRDRFLVTLDDAVRPLTDPGEIVATYARLLGEQLQADRCAYADVDEDQDTFNLTGDYNRGVPSIVGRYRFADFGEQCLRLMREDKPYVVHNVDTHRPRIADVAAYRQTMVQAVICVPLHKAGRLAAAMAVHQKVPRYWTREEIDLVRQVAGRCWESIERARVERTLRESEERFRSTFANAGVGIAHVGPDGRWLRINPKLCRILGYSREELLGMTFQDVTHPDDLSADLREVGRLLAGEIGTFTMEKRYVRKDRSTVWVNLTVSLMRDDAGQPAYFISVVEDITARKTIEAERTRAEEEAQRAKEAAEQANQAKDQFLAVLSHELRTPLSPVLAAAQMLEADDKLTPNHHDLAKMIRRNVELEARLIDDLLDLTRISRGKLELHAATVDFHEKIAHVTAMCREDFAAKSIRINLCLDAERRHVHGDPARLQQIIWNLLKNAVKFTPEGGKVVIRTGNPGPGDGDGAGGGGTLLLEVQDSGIGIAPDAMPRLFEAFEQGGRHITRQFGGLGLGLAISKALVSLHGGRISATSDGLHQGATFRVELPLSASTDTSPRRPARVQNAGGMDCTVLLVEDHADTRRTMTHLLTAFGCRVTSAGSVAEALAKAEMHQFNLVVSDIGLPDGAGTDLVRQLKVNYPVRAIALSGYGMEEDLQRSRAAGFDAHLTKPVDLHTLEETIRRVLAVPVEQ